MADRDPIPCGICGGHFTPRARTHLYCSKPECKRARARHRWRKWSEQEGSRERVTAYQRRYRKETHYGRKWEVKKKYGLEWDEYLALLDEYGHSCALCGESDDICVDHCHETGRVRGILCRKHNAAIGILGDSVDGLRAALDYLSRFDTNREEGP